MVEHVLKTLPDYWEAVERGDKNFEVRRDDRGFQKGDTVVLCKLSRTELNCFETEGGGTSCHGYNAKKLSRKIRYVLTGGQLGIQPGYVVLALGSSR